MQMKYLIYTNIKGNYQKKSLLSNIETKEVFCLLIKRVKNGENLLEH